MSGGFLEIIEFRHFVRCMTFASEGEKSRNKVLKNYVTVKVVIHMDVGNTRE